MDFLLKVVFGLGVFATIAAKNEGEGDLMKLFADEKKELRADFRREIDELKKQNDKQNRVDAEQKEEMKKLHNRVNKQNQVNAEQKKENAVQKEEIRKQKEEIKKLHAKLHQADVKNRKTNRQLDEKQNLELEAKIRSAINQERHSSELHSVVESIVKNSILRSSGDPNNTASSNSSTVRESDSSNMETLKDTLKNVIQEQITDYLINHRICVGDRYGPRSGSQTETVSFGHEFPRRPTVLASLSRVHKNEGSKVNSGTYVSSVSNTSAVIYSYSNSNDDSSANVYVSWLACL